MRSRTPGMIAVGVLLVCGVAAANPLLPNVNNFAFFGGDLNINLATVNGHVGVSNNGFLNFSGPSVINGNLYMGIGATGSLNGTLNGAKFVNQDLTTAQNEVLDASATVADYHNFYPTVALSSVTTSMTIASMGSVTVIDVSGNITLGGSDALTVTGGSHDIFIINVLGNFDLTGSGGIMAGAGMDPSRILINILGDSGTVISHINNIINGTVLVPYRTATFHGTNGAIYGGPDNQITIMSGATLNYDGFVPEPGAMTLMGLAAAALGIAGVVRRRKRA